ncbi:hypothetical protein T09_6085, partial [Trichinella sp. T9]
MPSAARLLLYSYVQRNFDYCSVHVSTVISHVSQQFRFMVFFIVTQWVVSGQWNYLYKLEYLSLMVVQVSLNGLKRCTKICKNGLHHQHRADIRSYSCVSLSCLMALPSIAPEICGFAYRRCTIHHTSLIVRVAIRAFADTLVLQIFSESNYVEIYMNEIVDKYVITKHYHQLMPLSFYNFAFHNFFIISFCNMTVDTYEDKWVSQPMGNMQIFICPQAMPGAMPQAKF